MSRDSGSEQQPGQRTVADLLKEYGTEGGQERAQQRGGQDRRRRRRSDDAGDTAPHQIIDRVLSDSGQMRPVRPDDEPDQRASGHHRSRRRMQAPAQQDPQQAQAAQAPRAPQAPGQPAAPPVPPGQQPGSAQSGASQPSTAQPSTAQPGQSGRIQPAPTADQPPEAAASEPTAKVRPVQPPPPSPAQSSGPSAAAPQTPAPDAETLRQPFPKPSDPSQPAGQSQQAGHSQHYSGQQAVSGQLEGVTERIPQVPPHPDPSGTRMLNDPRGAVDPSPSRPGVPAAPAEPPDRPGRPDDPAFAAAPGVGYPGYEDYADDADDYDAYDDFGDYRDHDFDGGPAPGDPARDELFGADDDRGERSPGKEWFVLTAQGFGGLLLGAGVFFGFTWLWKASSVAAFVAALVVTGALVLFARRMRGDDLQIILLAVLAGLFCTVSPVALLLLGR